MAEYILKVRYNSAICCLTYVMVCIRSNFTYAVSHVCKFMSKPWKRHWEAVKWIFRYLEGTIVHDFMFGSQHGDLSVVGFVDPNYASYLDDMRSTIGYSLLLQVSLFVGNPLFSLLW